MRKSIVLFFVLIIIFIACIILSSLIDRADKVNSVNVSDNSCIVIDAGHGGKDGGTIGADGALEKTINLDIALDLYDFFKVIGYNCELVRDGDYELYYEEEERVRSDLYNRLDFVNSFENPTLISIHQNHFENEREWGMQIWYSPNDEISKLIADEILSFTNSNIQKDNKRQNKVSDSSYYILYKASAPSVMVECGFMSNNNENALLQDKNYQKKIAYSIAMGFNNYKAQEK
ncbi:MAG: N-acetylmuramoyl-L-alanine amidase [Eubacterium sp.]|nr:N-acetylmuramoyl-L-alanine amidase [Eubacterium sp.]